MCLSPPKTTWEYMDVSGTAVTRCFLMHCSRNQLAGYLTAESLKGIGQRILAGRADVRWE